MGILKISTMKFLTKDQLNEMLDGDKEEKRGKKMKNRVVKVSPTVERLTVAQEIATVPVSTGYKFRKIV